MIAFPAPWIGQSSRYGLGLVAVRCDVNIGRANQRRHFPGADEAVVKDHFPLNAEIPGQGLQLIPVSIALAGPDMGMSGACNDVDSVL